MFFWDEIQGIHSAGHIGALHEQPPEFPAGARVHCEQLVLNFDSNQHFAIHWLHGETIAILKLKKDALVICAFQHYRSHWPCWCCRAFNTLRCSPGKEIAGELYKQLTQLRGLMLIMTRRLVPPWSKARWTSSVQRGLWALIAPTAKCHFWFSFYRSDDHDAMAPKDRHLVGSARNRIRVLQYPGHGMRLMGASELGDLKTKHRLPWWQYQTRICQWWKLHVRSDSYSVICIVLMLRGGVCKLILVLFRLYCQNMYMIWWWVCLYYILQLVIVPLYCWK